MTNTFIARLFDELEPCYPDTDVKKGATSYSVACANGTYAGVNIIMSGVTPGIPISVEVKGEHTGFKLFKMLPVPVEVNTGEKQRSEYLKNDHNDNVIRRAPFMVYEVLEPIYNIVMPTTTTYGVNFKSIVEYCKENTVQDWEITVTHGENKIVLNFSVDIYNVTVPKANKDTHKYVNWFSFENIATYHNIEKWSPRYFRMLEKYLRVAVYSRQNMLALPINECMDVVDGKVVLDKCLLKKIVDVAKKVGIELFEGGALAYRSDGLKDDDDFYNSLDHESFTNTDQVALAFKEKAFYLFDYVETANTVVTTDLIPSHKGEETLHQMARQIYEFVVENDLQDCYFQSALDEPNDALDNVYKILTDIIKEEMPGIPIFEPVLPTEKVDGCVDIWCPSLDIYEKNQQFFDERVERGDRLFVYSCLTPGGNYTNRLLDMERLRMVWIGWAPAKYTNIEGFLHWGANQYLDVDPLKRQAVMFSEQVMEFHPKRANFLPAGDYCIFYPGYNEPLVSVRSEAHRIGYEDLCLLEQLASKDEKKKDEIVNLVFRGYADYEKSVEKYREARKLLLESLTK